MTRARISELEDRIRRLENLVRAYERYIGSLEDLLAKKSVEVEAS